MPDYIVTEDLVVPNGIKLSIVEEDVIVFFEEETGILVQAGGTLTNVDASQDQGLDSEFIGDAGWKGILIDNGTIELSDAKIENAGKSAFSGQEEPAAITLMGDQTELSDLSNNEFISSFSFDILVTGSVNGSGKVTNNQLSYTIPIKAPINFMYFWDSYNPNHFPESYDYITLVPSGADIMDKLPDSRVFIFHAGGKYYIDGDFWSGSDLTFQSNTTIYIKESAGILLWNIDGTGSVHTRGSENEPVIIEGLNSAQWKGIAAGEKTSLRLEYAIIRNAGHGIIKMGSFEADAPAAIYAMWDGNMDGCQIINSGGYGYYNAQTKRAIFRLSNSTFSNTVLPAIRLTTKNIESAFWSDNHNNSFELGDGIAAVLVQEDGYPTASWYGLGGDNFYLIDATIQSGAVFRLEAGVILKFKAGQSLIRLLSSYGKELIINGTAENPVILDGELGTPGSWGGVYLGGEFQINHAIIKNGGEFLLPDASERANIVSAFNGRDDAPNSIKNTTIASSAGYGIVIENRTLHYGYDDPANNNTFIDNALDDLLDLGGVLVP